ncbi:Carboxypeptidase regulatory-like domain-containing protein [Granulicella pectinivorans]|jgi:hypothetical protein|uniref:Carboxypeptidase regulatory-like domain-containing protein n=1 Tax=Granulicella pectinivorans TaxID=474950 RepID=A0A1I6M2A4_9BACT|nr:carboxypeptidase-like regulatory domain-containing protein [Granulicella pectinivorans]SFS09840.1 Carboxypeptidase regulatory-like domain-containing protein [Granulicella pectinivorans]
MLKRQQERTLQLLCLLACLTAGPILHAQALLLDEALPEAPGFEQLQSTLTGTVKDIHGTPVESARVTLTGPTRTPQTTLSTADGRFRFDAIPPGPYTLTVKAAGLAITGASGIANPGETTEAPAFALPLTAAQATIDVVASREDVAAAQVEVEEKQRVLAIFPNFYVTYIQNPAPMTVKQKFGMAWKTSIDPVSFLMTGVVAGIEQAGNTYSGYGQGAAGYGRRYGASYGDDTISTFIAGAILPSVLHQDPRYFYKGTGSIKSRAWYAIRFVGICKGDNGKWQPNYSNVFGNLATAAISNAYYPAENRDGIGLTLGNALLGTAEGAIGNLFQEFLVRKLTPHVPDYGAVDKP